MKLVQPHNCTATGAILFFHENPTHVKSELLASANLIWSTFVGSAENLSKSLGRFEAFLDSESFESRAKFDCSPSTKKEAKPGRCLFMGNSPLPGRPSIPNFLYFEIPEAVPFDEVSTAFSSSFRKGPFFLGIADPVIVCNPTTYPQSGAMAVKAIKNVQASGKCADDTWLNPDYRRELSKMGPRMFDGPNMLTAISPEIEKECIGHLDWESILKLLDRTERDFFLIKAVTASDRRLLADALSSGFVEIPKPRMFWKQLDWDIWRAEALAGSV